MPHYEYRRAWNRSSSKILRLIDYEERYVDYPHCGSQEVEHRWSVFYAISHGKAPEEILLAVGPGAEAGILDPMVETWTLATRGVFPARQASDCVSGSTMQSRHVGFDDIGGIEP